MHTVLSACPCCDLELYVCAILFIHVPVSTISYSLLTFKIAELQASYERSVAEKERLTKNIQQTEGRLKRAAKLTTGLADEQVRWAESVEVGECHGWI